MHQEVKSAHYDAPDYDPKTKEHYWIVLVGYRITNPLRFEAEHGPLFLDQENRVTVSPVICLHCERMWDSRLHYRTCPGEPS